MSHGIYKKVLESHIPLFSRESIDDKSNKKKSEDHTNHDDKYIYCTTNKSENASTCLLLFYYPREISFRNTLLPAIYYSEKLTFYDKLIFSRYSSICLYFFEYLLSKYFVFSEFPRMCFYLFDSLHDIGTTCAICRYESLYHSTCYTDLICCLSISYKYDIDNIRKLSFCCFIKIFIGYYLFLYREESFGTIMDVRPIFYEAIVILCKNNPIFWSKTSYFCLKFL